MKRRLVLVALFLISCSSKNIAQNIARNKECSLSVAPNYKLAGTNAKVLTDGSVSNGTSFWQKKSTLGWQYQKRIEMLFSFSKSETIKDVTFNTARREIAGVYYPMHVYVFVSNDKKMFKYAGDIVEDQMNTAGSYQVNKFSLNNINQSGKYLKLVIIPQGKFVFCDEIEVIKGNKINTSTKNSIFKVAAINNAVDSLIILGQKRRNLNAVLSGKSTQMKGNSQEKSKSLQTIDQLEFTFKSRRIAELKKKFTGDVVVEKYNPWEDLPLNYMPKTNSAINYNYSLIVDNSQYGAFVITNMKDSDANYSFNVSNSNEAVKLELFSTPYLSTVNNAYLIDPILPIGTGNLRVLSGASALVIFKISALTEGLTSQHINVKSGSIIVSKLNLAIQSYKVSIPEEARLNAINWAYLNYPMLKGRKKEALRDLTEHKINSFVVTGDLMPKINQYDFTKMNDYISNFPTSSNILLLYSFRGKGRKDVSNKILFMSDQWKVMFVKWYKEVLGQFAKKGFSSNKIYWYPYDEIKTTEIQDFIKFSNWAKKNVPNLKIFTTILYKETLKIIPYTNVAMIISNLNVEGSTFVKKGDGNWLYSVIQDAREQSPYDAYRLMAWRAFVKDYKGIGFWNYADIGKSRTQNNLNTPISDINLDYAVIYTGTGSEIIKSRRWEAFTLGLEDFSILKLYAKKFGDSKAKFLAQSVISNKKNKNMADKIRDEMMKALF